MMNNLSWKLICISLNPSGFCVILKTIPKIDLYDFLQLKGEMVMREVTVGGHRFYTCYTLK